MYRPPSGGRSFLCRGGARSALLGHSRSCSGRLPNLDILLGELFQLPPGIITSTCPASCGKARPHTLQKFFSTTLALLLAALPLPIQQSPITVNVAAVNLLATVRDKHGNLVRNLSKDDFSLEQDTKPQSITYFAKESDLPLTLGLLVDTSLSQRRVLDQERTASRSSLDHVLREDKDKAFLIHFDHEVELLQDLTSSRQKLQSAIDQIHTPQFSQTSSTGGSGGSGSGHRPRSHDHRPGGGPPLYNPLPPA